MDDHNPENLPTTNSQRELSLRQGANSQEWKMGISAALTRLASHYWRPDFDAPQVKHFIADYLCDLSDYSVADVEVACAAWRRNGENKFFPRPGELLAILNPKPSEMRRESHLPKFRGWPKPDRPATLSVAQVLRNNGFEIEARRWESPNPVNTNFQ